MQYAEMAYFDGNHCHHVATWQDWKEDKRKTRKRLSLFDRQSVKDRRSTDR